jgi:hypothetical protein
LKVSVLNNFESLIKDMEVKNKDTVDKDDVDKRKSIRQRIRKLFFAQLISGSVHNHILHKVLGDRSIYVCYLNL